MAVNKRSSSSKTKNEEDDIRLDVDGWDVSINVDLVISKLTFENWLNYIKFSMSKVP